MRLDLFDVSLFFAGADLLQYFCLCSCVWETQLITFYITNSFNPIYFGNMIGWAEWKAASETRTSRVCLGKLVKCISAGAMYRVFSL